MQPRYSPEEIALRVGQRTWYHKIDLHGVVTPGYDFDGLWDEIRRVRQRVDYQGKRVLDLASYDGMWAFEAEALGASRVIATDIYPNFVLDNFLLCREILGSSCFPYYNVSPYRLYERLDSVMQEDARERHFDIVQNFGLLYHLRDPLWCLSQCRSVIKTGGLMIVESAVFLDSDRPVMVFNNNGTAGTMVHDDITTWWLPTVPCLIEMLKASLFEVDMASVKIIPGVNGLGRCCLVSQAISPDAVSAQLAGELARTDRNPGMDISLFQRIGANN
ncbi:MAG: DUF1698 domain-containing protein [Magnetospirillum gryphiswaldense]|nr:DUF1698 domain-containing protein [Magnetospirillum gryphiswaldense]